MTFKCFVNADVGEGCGQDELLIQHVHMVNVACGGHAGDEQSMRATLELAKRYGAHAGAHPSYPDREGFGRRRPPGPLSGLYGELCTQIEAFENLAAKAGIKTAHFKPHGQLYNDAAFNAEVAGLLLRVAADFPHLDLVVLAQSPLVLWAQDEGIDVIEEGFPDRGYLSDGRLVPRHLPGACLSDLEHIAKQAKAMVSGASFMSVEGAPIRVKADTLCVHGDSPLATDCARAVAEALLECEQE
ncbi:MAG: LamB/YcsF family protein [Limnobacter sp.]|nr:LamB/YcsF family protein [Limnobacter sp.]